MAGAPWGKQAFVTSKEGSMGDKSHRRAIAAAVLSAALSLSLAAMLGACSGSQAPAADKSNSAAADSAAQPTTGSNTDTGQKDNANASAGSSSTTNSGTNVASGSNGTSNSSSTSSNSSSASSNTSSGAAAPNTDTKGTYLSVLQGKSTFFSTDAGKDISVSQLNQAVSPDSSVKAVATRFALIDLDKDGVQECVLQLKVNNDEYFGSLVLSYRNGRVYGYTLWYRVFYQLKSDGTFNFSGGVGNSGFGTISFTNTAYTVKQVTYSESSTGSDGKTSISYYVDQKASTQDKYEAAMGQQDAKPFAMWYDFTDSVIKSVLS